MLRAAPKRVIPHAQQGFEHVSWCGTGVACSVCCMFTPNAMFSRGLKIYDVSRAVQTVVHKRRIALHAKCFTEVYHGL